MNATPTKSVLLLVCLLGLTSWGVSADAGSIVQTGGGADLTFFYDSVNDRFDVVFRPKDAVFSGGTPYGIPPGGVGGSSADLAFGTLSVVTNNPGFRTLNGNDYHTMGPVLASPDLGIRMRFRENELDAMHNVVAVVDQFDDFQMELDWANSSVPIGAEFAMWNVNEFGTSETVQYETVASNYSASWPNWGHSHWIYGFSKMGTYDLAFNIQGFLNGDPATSVGNFNLSVSTVPEPTTTSLMILAMGCLASGWRSRRRRGADTQRLATNV